MVFVKLTCASPENKYLHSCSKTHVHKTRNTQYRRQNTQYVIQKLMYIKLLMYFFYMALGHNDFDGGKSITGAIGRGEP